VRGAGDHTRLDVRGSVDVLPIPPLDRAGDVRSGSPMKVRLSPLRLHQIMYAMIYPAVLGSFIYAYGDKAANSAFALSDPVPWLIGFLFIALLTLDYIYSIGSSVQSNYSMIEFCADLLIVVLLYGTLQAILRSPMAGLAILSGISIWLYLFAIKLVASLWEVWDRFKHRNLPQTKDEAARIRPLESDIAFCLIALVCLAASLVVPKYVDVAFLAAFLVFDGIYYITYTSDS
jgi:hypothetical protein